jgi:hypothetical protein
LAVLVDSLSISGSATTVGAWCCDFELSEGANPRAVVPPADGPSFVHALVRLHGEPFGYVTVPVSGDGVDLGGLCQAAWARYATHINRHLVEEGLPGMDELTAASRPPPATAGCPNVVVSEELVSVVVCARHGTDVLVDCLSSLRMLTYPRLEVIVVDTAPADGSTRRLMESLQLSDGRFRYAVEPRAGLSYARNRGLAEARGTYVAFTDDDVSVDPGWIEGLLRGFRRRDDVGCVTGLMCRASITNEAEAYLAARTSARMEPDVVGTVGTAFAFDRALLRRLGGFDEALDAGGLGIAARTRFAGRAIAYEPSALAWDRRRVDRTVLGVRLRELAGQAAGPFLYARSAWTATLDRPTEAAAQTVSARLALSSVSLAAFVFGAVAVALDVNPVRIGCLLVFSLLGIGSAPWQLNRAIRLPARMTLTTVTSLAVLTLVSQPMLALGQWHPLTAFVVVAAVCVPLHLAGLRLALSDAEWARPRPSRVPLVHSTSMVLARVGAVLAISAALIHRHLDPGFYGFLPTIGIAWYVGIGLILAALALSRATEEREIAVPVLLLVVVLTLTPALVYDGPRSQSAAKHVDLVLHIMSAHRLDSTVEIYNSWSGFFTATAWLSGITGIRDPMRLATFWPALLAVFRISALRYLFGQVLHRPHQVWVAVALAVLADPLGADYFSPQSVGFVIGLAVYGLALSKTVEPYRLPLIFVAGWVLAVTHQLTPYGVGGVLLVLVVFRQVRPWWTPLLVLGPAVFWAAIHRGALSGFLSWDTLGRVQNFHPPKTAESSGLQRLPVVGYTVRALLLEIAILGLVALIALALHRREPRMWAFACCPAVGLVLVAVNPYGQEGIFRAALFGMPWLALMAAHCFPSSPRQPRLVANRVTLFAVTTVLGGAFLVHAFGLDAINVIRPADVAAFRYFQEQRTDRTGKYYLLALGTGDLPTSLPVQPGDYRTLRRDDLKQPVRQERVPRPDLQMQALTARMLSYTEQRGRTISLYAIWSPVSSDNGWAYGIQSPDQFRALRDAFRRAPYWHVVLERDGTFLFRFEPTRYPGAAG